MNIKSLYLVNRAFIVGLALVTALAAVDAQSLTLRSSYFGTGSVEWYGEITGAGNVTKSPTVLVLKLFNVAVEQYCINNGGNVGAGVAFYDVLESAEPIGGSAFQADKNGKYKFKITVGIPEKDALCTSNTWKVIPGSGVAKSFMFSGTVHPCTDTSCAVYDQNKVLDSLTGFCSIDPIIRNADYTVLAGQTYICTYN